MGPPREEPPARLGLGVPGGGLGGYVRISSLQGRLGTEQWSVGDGMGQGVPL